MTYEVDEYARLLGPVELLNLIGRSMVIGGHLVVTGAVLGKVWRKT